MSEAMELSSRYDLIIVLEWLRDGPTYMHEKLKIWILMVYEDYQ